MLLYLYRREDEVDHSGTHLRVRMLFPMAIMCRSIPLLVRMLPSQCEDFCRERGDVAGIERLTPNPTGMNSHRP